MLAGIPLAIMPLAIVVASGLADAVEGCELVDVLPFGWVELLVEQAAAPIRRAMSGTSTSVRRRTNGRGLGEG